VVRARELLEDAILGLGDRLARRGSRSVGQHLGRGAETRAQALAAQARRAASIAAATRSIARLAVSGRATAKPRTSALAARARRA
jgi:hypothetical protein